VDDLDAIVRQQLVKARVAAWKAELLGARRCALGGGTENAVDLDAEAAQRLDVDGADEAAADHGRADLARTPHVGPRWPDCLDICGARKLDAERGLHRVIVLWSVKRKSRDRAAV
jgi:hypothetical protein